MELSRIAKAVAIATFGVLTVTPVAGQAASILPFLTNGVNTLQDTDVERILRPNDAGGFDVVTDGSQLQVNDIIETAMRWDTVNGAGIPALVGSLSYQMMAYSRIEILALNNCAGTVCDITFGSGFADGVTAAIVYEADPGPLAAAPFSAASAGGTADGQIAAITIGTTRLFGVGFVEADDFWTAAASETDTSTFPGLEVGEQVGVGNFGLSLVGPSLINVENNVIPAFDAVAGVLSFHAFGGNTSIFGLDNNTVAGEEGWAVSSNSTVRFSQVPEPGTMALLGLALLGAGVATRRGARQRQDGLV